MKLKKHVILALVAGLFVWAGCTDKMQSELSMVEVEKNAGSATIQGQVSYNAGTTGEEGSFVTDNVLPAAEVDVVVSVNYKAYSNGSQGKKQFIAKTDANGNYSIQLPVGSKPIAGAEVEVDVLPFKRTFSKEVNGVLKTVEDAVYNQVAYTAGAKNTPLENAKVEVCNMLVSTLADLDPNSRSQRLTVKGDVYAAALGKVDKDDALKGLKASPEKKSVPKLTIVVKNSKIVGGKKVDERELKYSISSNAEGAYSVDVIFFDTWDYSDVKVDVIAEAFYVSETEADSKGFSHYFTVPSDDNKKWLTQSLAGVYEESKVANKAVAAINSIVALKVDVPAMKFEPENKDIIRGLRLKDKGTDVNYWVVPQPVGFPYPYAHFN
ncbi:hypothetical protein SDC9_27783 [bioreactor metagenome]|uniref:Uncharacterized protein n=1 Tax=bioreactor metagenome TaxID=1076179 RepID=A0A644USS9_9ZZZZ|nr:hypothetical protein [Paludibacter sp.]